MAVYSFDGFQLSEESRSLSLGGHEVAVQPLVFDFLSYLLKNQDRAVSKDELMTALWPRVTVTEASLQRVASLARQTLRLGDADKTLRSIPRFGYRLCPGPFAAPPAPRPEGMPDEADGVATALAAIAAKRWTDAVAAFREADGAGRLEAEELEAYALALECVGRPADAIDPLTRAVTAYCLAGNEADGSRPAIALSRIHLERGDLAVASGWLGRARELIGENQAGREFGLWCWMAARLAAANDRLDEALALAEQAYAIGKSLDDPMVESLGLIYRGFFRLCLGETEPGLEDQHLAAARGLSSGLDPIVGGILYCNILWACRNFGDWGRANEWTASYIGWCTDAGMSNLTGSCRVHRAEVLGVSGSLKEAGHLILEAIEQLAEDAPWATGDAYRVLGDIRFAEGDFEAARSAYQQAHAAGWITQPGLSRLQMESGDAEAAYSGLERSLRGKGWQTLQRRGLILATLAIVAAKTGRESRAREIIGELESEPGRWPMPAIKALVAEAKAELLAKEGRHDDAIAELQSACAFWSLAGSPINVAEARLRLADLLISTGDMSAAGIELQAARSIGESLGALRIMRRVSDIDAARKFVR